MNEIQLIAIVAAILASKARSAPDARGYWEGGKDREARVRHEQFMADCTLDGIDLVRDLPRAIESFDRITAEEEADHAKVVGTGAVN
jgi:hypothetical protein